MLDAAADLKRMEQALLSRSQKLHVRLVSNAQAGVQKTATYILRRDGSKLSVDMRTPYDAGLDRNERIYYVSDSNLTALDRLNAEWLQRPIKGTGSPVHTLGTTLGGLDEGLRFIANPSDTRELFKRFRQVKAWSRSVYGERVRLEQGEGGSRIRIEFRSGDALPSQIQLFSPSVKLTWNYEYLPARPVVPPSTTGINKVDSFIARPAIARFVDSTSEAVTRKVFLAQRNLRRGVIQLSTGEKIFVYENSIGEDVKGVRWRFQAGKLTVISQSGAFAGAAKRGDVISYLAGTSPVGVTTITRDLLAFRAPLRYQLGSDFRARTIGSMNVAGKQYRLVEFRSDSRKHVWHIDVSTNRIARWESETLGRMGEVVSRSNVTYTYSTLNGGLPTLALPKGMKWQPLPSLEG
jgi:hypothetical protein